MGAPAALDVETVSGNISIDSAPADSDVSSVSGKIEIGAAGGSIDVENDDPGPFGLAGLAEAPGPGIIEVPDDQHAAAAPAGCGRPETLGPGKRRQRCGLSARTAGKSDDDARQKHLHSACHGISLRRVRRVAERA